MIAVQVAFEPNSRQRAASRASAARRYPAHVARQLALAHARRSHALRAATGVSA